MIATRSRRSRPRICRRWRLQILDVVADAAHAELAEIGEILADLRGVQVELLGQRLRRDRLDAAGSSWFEAAQVDRQAVGRELGDLLGAAPRGGEFTGRVDGHRAST